MFAAYGVRPIQVPLRRVRLGQDLRCWSTDNGGTICTNSMYYSPKCPKSPPVTEFDRIVPTPPEAAGAS